MLALIAAAAGMVLVIYSESLGAAETFAAKHGYDIDPNQELIALGAANVGSADSSAASQAAAAFPRAPSTKAPGRVRRCRRWLRRSSPSSPCSS